jgi:dephospho-CoA kinase
MRAAVTGPVTGVPGATAGLVIGLTGGIGSGKSAAAECFGRLGAAVVDTDAIAHELTAPGGAAMPALRRVFGDAVVAPDGRLDREAMRRLVFADPAMRRRLESVLHPLIRDLSAERCAGALTAGVPYVILMVPLLVESGDYRRRVARVVVVDCPDELRIARVGTRSGLAPDQVRAIMAAQASREVRLAAADDVIDNSGGLEALTAQVERLHRQYLSLAGRSGPGPSS